MPRTCTGEVCVRSRLPPSSQKVSCMSRAGWSGGNVQRVEIVIFGFHLGAVEHGEAQRDEQVLDFPLDLRDGMQVARGAGRARAA